MAYLPVRQIEYAHSSGEAPTTKATLIAPWIALAIAAAAAPRARAQPPQGHEGSPDAAASDYDLVARSVVRIQTIAQVDKRVTDPLTGLPSTRRSQLVAYGTGIVIDTLYVDGRIEYVILTNHHVTNLNLILDDFARKMEARNVPAQHLHAVESRSYLAFGTKPEAGGHRVRLVEIVHDETADMSLMRTVDADWPLAVFPHDIGFRPGDLEVGTPIITSGFRMTGGGITFQGTITGLTSHALGVPHADYTVDLPLEQGQSGSPVFLEAGLDGRGRVRFALVGLLHARESGEHFMIPYTAWRETLCRTPTGKRRSTYCGS